MPSSGRIRQRGPPGQAGDPTTNVPISESRVLPQYGRGRHDFCGGVLLLASCAQSTDDHRPPGCEARDLALPLVLQRCRTDDQRTLDTELMRHDFCRRQRLDRLAQTHLIANEAAIGARREQRAFALILV